VLPDFIVIGAQRCGTSHFYGLLITHPCISPASRKEIHFFDYNFNKGILWYRKHFPPYLLKDRAMKKCGYFITGEASPYYIFYPHAAKRISKLMPNIKLIILLRNPVDRAYSHYCHEVRTKEESLSFEDAIKKEEERMQGELDKMIADETYYSFNHQHSTYLSRGIYIDQIKAWMDIFPRRQFLILKSEDFFDNQETTIKKTLKFLGLPDELLSNCDFGSTPRQYPYPKMEDKVRKRLIDYYKPYNQKLYELLGVNFDWDR
jgi:hypothetical protein